MPAPTKPPKKKAAPTADSKQVRALHDQLAATVAELEVLRDEEGGDVDARVTKMEELATRGEKLQNDIDRLRKIAARELELKAVFNRAAPAGAGSGENDDDDDTSDDDTSDDERTIAGGKQMRTRAPVYAEVRHGFIKGFGADPEAGKRAYRAGMWYRGVLYKHADSLQWCRDNGVIDTRAQEIGTDALGGALVPNELVNQLIILVNEYGQFAPNVRVVPMKQETLDFPLRVGGLQHYFIGEGKPLQESDATWDRVKLVAKKMAVANRQSTEVMEDSIIELGSYLTEEFGRAYAMGVDHCGFNGDGVDPIYGGIKGIIPRLQEVGTSLVTSAGTGFETMTIADFVAVTAKIQPYALSNAKWYISPTGFAAAMQRLALTSGSFTGLSGGNTQSDIQEKIGLRFMGYPVVLCNALDTVSGPDSGKVKVLFGDLAMGVLMGDRRKVTIRTSYERLVELDQVLMTSTMRFDVNVHAAGTKADPAVPGSKDASGPIVGLETA
jgi:HK97 family phage major capsid protein